MDDWKYFSPLFLTALYTFVLKCMHAHMYISQMFPHNEKMVQSVKLKKRTFLQELKMLKKCSMMISANHRCNWSEQYD